MSKQRGATAMTLELTKEADLEPGEWLKRTSQADQFYRELTPERVNFYEARRLVINGMEGVTTGQWATIADGARADGKSLREVCKMWGLDNTEAHRVIARVSKYNARLVNGFTKQPALPADTEATKKLKEERDIAKKELDKEKRESAKQIKKLAAQLEKSQEAQRTTELQLQELKDQISTWGEQAKKDRADEFKRLTETVKRKEKELDAIKTERDELKERFTHSRDEEAIRARWRTQAVNFYNWIDQMRGQRPDIHESLSFEEEDRTLLDGLIKRLLQVAGEYKELVPGSQSFIEATSRLPMVVDSNGVR